MKEIVIISGKGGTGKTSITATFAALAGHPVICDCDVDAADLHLLLSPQIRKRHEFYAGREAIIQKNNCIGCGRCYDYCRFGAVKRQAVGKGDFSFSIDPFLCEGCGVCVRFCPATAIDFPERRCGEWFVSSTRYGPMIHARLGKAAENSGKLVSTVRREGQRIAEERNITTIIVDGPPGIGCPVIASVTGASLVVAITEPTVSGDHDLERVLSLTRHFQIPTVVCINKWDINPAMTEIIEKKAILSGAGVAGRIRYDEGVTKAQLERKTIMETHSACMQDIRQIWENINL